jgi:hypothetical protein
MAGLNFEAPVPNDPNTALYQRLNALEARVSSMERNRELIVTPLTITTLRAVGANVTSPSQTQTIVWNGGKIYLLVAGYVYSGAANPYVTMNITLNDVNGTYVAGTSGGGSATTATNSALPTSFRPITSILTSANVSPGPVVFNFSAIGTYPSGATFDVSPSGFFIEWPTA